MHKRERMAHLLRRSGFTAHPEEIKKALARGYESTVIDLIQRANRHRLKEEPPSTPLPPVVLPVTILNFAQGVIWWMKTMATSSSPLNERIALFWHRHFATSGAKVFHPGWMFQQNVTFREHGRGPFADLLKAMVKDPALLNWLDAARNPAERPNENLARELLELFTLGIGNYTEKDVKELAKLTTGTRLRLGGKTSLSPQDAYDGPVRLLGRKGQLKLADMVELLAVHPATAERMVRHLWEDFAACPLPDKEGKRLQKIWRQSRGHVSVVLREIFLSEHFHDAKTERVSSPVEFWVACARLLNWESFKLEDAGFLEQCGEQLFFPPSVKGWDLGIALIHPAALQTRLEIAQRIVERLPKDHFALRGLATTPNRSRYLQHLSGGQIKAGTLPNNLDSFEAQDALFLALASPDMWMN